MANMIEVQTNVVSDGEYITTTWTLGDSSVSTRFPVDEDKFKATVEDLSWLCENIDRLVDSTSAAIEQSITDPVS